MSPLRPPLPQLPAPHRYAAVAKQLALAAGAPLRRSVDAEQAQDASAVEEVALDLADRVLRQPTSASLSAFLQDWIAQVDTFAQGYGALSGAPHAKIDHFVRRIALEVEALRCEHCAVAGTTGTPCGASMTAADPEGGRCLAEFTLLFDFAIALSNELYLSAGIAHSTLASVAFRLSTAQASAIEPRPVADIGVSGSWRPPTGAMASSASVIELRVAVKDLNVRSMRAVLYVVLHEAIAHGYQRLGAAVRTTGGLDSFAEGWMDFVAGLVFRRALDRSYATLVGRHPTFGIAVRPVWLASAGAGLELYEAREHGFAGAHVRQGRLLAEQLLWSFTLASGGAASEDVFLELSCRLNVAALSGDERRLLVQRLSFALPEPDVLAEDVHRPALAILAAYARDRDIDRFVQAAQALKSIFN